MAERLSTETLIPDDFFEIPGDPCIYSVDFVYVDERTGEHSVIATNCQTSQLFAFPASLTEVDFLYR